MSDDNVTKDVKDELHWDPKIDASEIAVAAENGVITLRGTVGTFSQRLKGDVSYQIQSDAAYEDVARLFGVIAVTNEINVINPSPR